MYTYVYIAFCKLTPTTEQKYLSPGRKGEMESIFLYTLFIGH